MTPSTPSIHNLSPAQRQMLLRQLAERKAKARQPRIVPAPRNSGFVELSFAQERLWVMEQLAPGSPLCNMSGAAHVTGELDLQLWNRTLNLVIERHEVLRSTFDSLGDGPRCAILPSLTVKSDLIDAEGMTDEQVRARLAEEARRPFDLRTGPLIRCAVARRSAREFFVLLTMHHIVSDGHSTQVLFQECGAIYSALRAKRPPMLPELPAQYADFAHFQRQGLDPALLDAQTEYWKRQLAGMPQVLELPADRRRPVPATNAGKRQAVRLGAKLTSSLRDLSRNEGATLFVTLLAGFATVLSRYARQQDFAIGVPVAGRGYPEVQDLIGCFLNTLPLRADLRGDLTFRELFQRLRTVTLDGFARQDVPFEKIVEALNVERAPGFTPLVQAMFSLESNATANFSMPELEIRFEEIETGTAKTDLTLELTEEGQELAGWLEYSSDVFSEATAGRLAGQFETVLQQMVRDPEQKVREVRLMKRAEMLRIAHDWNDTETDYPSSVSVKDLFERQAAATPDRLAVQYGDRSLSYAELNRRANQVAESLRRCGCRGGAFVGLLMNRSLEFVVATVGIVKTGAAYVPLDPAYPAERLRLMIEDSQLETILTTAELAGTIPDFAGSLLRVEDCDESHAANPAIEVHADDVAYVMYTSGSTGTPKGVAVPNRGITRLVLHTNYVKLGPDDRIAQVSNISFDAATFEIWGALLNGGALVGIDKDIVLRPAKFASELAVHGITAMFLTAALCHRMAVEEPGAFAGVRHLISGGDALDPHSIRKIVTHPRRPRRFLNGYGPTESTTFAAWHEVAEVVDGDTSIPIGKPLANTTLYVLDDAMELVPAGAIGELYIGGDGLAHGYHRRPGITAEKFVPDPFHSRPGARLYRTGDLARYREDGAVEFLGRTDDQVKIRGFRIEPGEVEAALRSHPSVREAAVMVRQDGPGGKRLVGYVALQSGTALADVRDALRRRLPEYMMPAAWVELENLPLNANGKVDRRALPAPAAVRKDAVRDSAAPQTDIETAIGRAWCSVLGIDKVGANDNFFDLGGDSIMAIQVAARCNQEGILFTPAQLIQHQTIAALSAVAGNSVAPAADQSPVTGPAPLTPIQRWFFERQSLETRHWNQAVLLEMTKPAPPLAVERAVRAIVEHHDALRLRFAVRDGRVEQEFASVGDGLPLAVEDLSDAPDERLPWIVEQRAAAQQKTLDLVNGPIVRAVFFDCGAARPARLLLAIHHLAVDGVSWRMLLEDLESALEQISAGGEVKLPAKTASFKTWAERLVDHALSPEVTSQLPYWREQHDAPALTPDYQAEPARNVGSSAAVVGCGLTADETASLLRKAPQAYRTQIDDLLLTALAIAFARQGLGHSLSVSLESHGREELGSAPLDISRTVGWFTSLAPVRLTLDADRPFDVEAAVKAVKEQLRARPAGGVGYGLLRYLNPEGRELANAVPPQMSFNYLGQFDGLLDRAKWFRMADENAGEIHGPESRRGHLIEIDGMVMRGCLTLNWTYSACFHSRHTVENLASTFIAELRAIIAHCVNPESAGFTPSDFPLARLDRMKLDRIEKALARGNRKGLQPRSRIQ